MSVGVIIVNFFTETLLRPLVGQLERMPLVTEIVVFDNGSSAPVTFPQGKARVQRAGANVGFAAAVNRAAASLSSDYILVVNPDVRLDDACVARLLDAAVRYQCPLLGPRFYWDDERCFRLPPATGELRWPGAGAPGSVDGALRSLYWAEHHDHYWAATTPIRQPFLSGACLLLARAWVKARGRVFDDRFFMYYEDTDLCIDAQREGIVPLCVPGAEAVHYWDQSPDAETSKAEMMGEARSRFVEKYYPSGAGEGASAANSLGGVPSISVQDLGAPDEPPSFRARKLPAGAFFEIALDLDFVPFAQALAGADGFRCDARPASRRLGDWLARRVAANACENTSLVLPRGLWQRLRTGRYYARLRGPDGRVLMLWRWRRSD